MHLIAKAIMLNFIAVDLQDIPECNACIAGISPKMFINIDLMHYIHIFDTDHLKSI